MPNLKIRGQKEVYGNLFYLPKGNFRHIFQKVMRYTILFKILLALIRVVEVKKILQQLSRSEKLTQFLEHNFLPLLNIGYAFNLFHRLLVLISTVTSFFHERPGSSDEMLKEL